MAKVRGTHSSPGVYTEIVDIPYAAQTAGITKLGLVGETTMGPAFEPTPVTNWTDFKDKFGGTSTELFYGSKYPKYELPYIAKSYLSASDQLQVCRVLGLSGYNAGTAFVVTAGPSTNPSDGAHVVAVLRARGEYRTGSGSDYCSGSSSEYDKVSFEVANITLSPYTSPAKIDRCSDIATSGSTESEIVVSGSNLGTFKINCFDKNGWQFWSGVVSFNRWSKDYIYDVIGDSPSKTEEDSAPIYIEDLYDFALQKMAEEGTVSRIHSNTVRFVSPSVNAVSEPATDFVNIPSLNLSRKDLGHIFLADSIAVSDMNTYYYFNSTTTYSDYTFYYGNSGNVVSQSALNALISSYGLQSVDNIAAMVDAGLNTLASVHNEQTYNFYTNTSAQIPTSMINSLLDYAGIDVSELVSMIDDEPSLTNMRVITVDNAYEFYLDGSATPLDYNYVESYCSRHGITVDILGGILSDGQFGFVHGMTYSRVSQAIFLDKNGNVVSNLVVNDVVAAGGSGMTVAKLASFVEEGYSVLVYTRSEDVTINETPVCMSNGGLYVVMSYLKNGARKYCYTQYSKQLTKYNSASYISEDRPIDVVKVLSTGKLYALDTNGNPVPYFSVGDYTDQYRCATTPWVVSELKGDGSNVQVKKLFRFHTISDGASANKMIKFSISEIRPDEGLFDLQIRDFNDSDSYPVILESYKKLSMKPGDPNYIGLKIGTIDGSYEPASRYVLVEVIDNEMTRNCVPCGFLGYPIRDYKAASLLSLNPGVNLVPPMVEFNTEYNEDINDRKQYFGLSDINGNSVVDPDLFTYKGKAAYTEDYSNGYTSAFHLDSTINKRMTTTQTGGMTVTVDGDATTSGMTWETVSPDFYVPYTHSPIIGSEQDMIGCIFENNKLRKFTFYPCGGFDGWDPFRTSRTNTNDYKYNKYKGIIKNGQGYAFSKVSNPEELGLDSNAITTDYYAYLAGAKQFEIPEKHQINLFATPGIDYVNNAMLVSEIVDMIEDERGDSLYVVTTPDKPFGASDSAEDMFTSSEAVSNLEASGIDTYYAATYYPWVKYFDADNSMYIHLPATKDVVRNMANVDNKRYPWITPAGMERGNVECKKMRFFTKIEDEDTLYDGLINPLKTFSEDGVKVWGNKTMYSADTPMNRINTVRLVLYMRYLIVQAANKLIFDQNDPTLKNDLENIINPILQDIKDGRGIFAYKLKTSQTTAQIDAHEISGQLWIKPTPSLEYINLSFIVTPTSVNFEDA